MKEELTSSRVYWFDKCVNLRYFLRLYMRVMAKPSALDEHDLD
jgi:hypothetical protein